MKQNIWQASNVSRIHNDFSRKKESFRNEIPKEKWAEKVSEILNSNFHHPHAPIMKNTIKRIPYAELISLSIFLTSEHGVVKNPLQRPECPIKNSRYFSAATYNYKKAMIDYISGFGYELRDAPCSYPPALLEALATYCEKGGKIDENMKIYS